MGFLYIQDTVANGNQGLLDQRLALKWIFENAKNFGGDNSKITISSESAGGHSVGFHLVNKTSWPYFSSAIIVSRTSASKQNELISIKEAIKCSTNISISLNCSRITNKETLKCLESVDPISLINAGKNVQQYLPLVLDEVLIKKQLSDSFASGESKNASLLIGSNSKEYPFVFPFFQRNITNMEQYFIGNISLFKNYLFNIYENFPISKYRPNSTVNEFVKDIICLFK